VTIGQSSADVVLACNSYNREQFPPEPGAANGFLNHWYFTKVKGDRMKTKLALCLVAGALLLPAAGFAADTDSKRAAAREFVKDSVITTKVKAELAREKPSTLVKVSVETDKAGIVVLSGTAKTQADKDRAELLARQVKGVATVENQIAVKAF